MNWMKKLFQRIHLLPRRSAHGRFVGRMRTHDDTALKYRMGAGYAGAVNRSHPASIEPCFPDQTNPPTDFGQPVVIDGSSHLPRAILYTDNGADAIYGITVRPFPIQQAQASNDYAAIGLGSNGLPKSQAMDVLRSGYIMAKLNVTGAVKGGRVYVWAVATSGSHVIGGFEVAACSGKTVLLDEKSYYNGVEDANKIVEIGFNL
jgi:hypothetical protein